MNSTIVKYEDTLRLFYCNNALEMITSVDEGESWSPPEVIRDVLEETSGIKDLASVVNHEEIYVSWNSTYLDLAEEEVYQLRYIRGYKDMFGDLAWDNYELDQSDIPFTSNDLIVVKDDTHLVYEHDGIVYIRTLPGTPFELAEGYQPRVTADTDNNIYVFYTRSGTLYVRKFNEPFQSWSQEFAVAETDIYANYQQISADYSFNGLYVSFVRDSKVYFSFSEEGTSWSVPVEIPQLEDEDAFEFSPNLVTDCDGNLTCITGTFSAQGLIEGSFGYNQFSYSSDLGTSWSEPQLIKKFAVEDGYEFAESAGDVRTSIVLGGKNDLNCTYIEGKKGIQEIESEDVIDHYAIYFKIVDGQFIPDLESDFPRVSLGPLSLAKGHPSTLNVQPSIVTYGTKMYIYEYDKAFKRVIRKESSDKGNTWSTEETVFEITGQFIKFLKVITDGRDIVAVWVDDSDKYQMRTLELGESEWSNVEEIEPAFGYTAGQFEKPFDIAFVDLGNGDKDLWAAFYYQQVGPVDRIKCGFLSYTGNLSSTETFDVNTGYEVENNRRTGVSIAGLQNTGSARAGLVFTDAYIEPNVGYVPGSPGSPGTPPTPPTPPGPPTNAGSNNWLIPTRVITVGPVGGGYDFEDADLWFALNQAIASVPESGHMLPTPDIPVILLADGVYDYQSQYTSLYVEDKTCIIRSVNGPDNCTLTGLGGNAFAAYNTNADQQTLIVEGINFTADFDRNTLGDAQGNGLVLTLNDQNVIVHKCRLHGDEDYLETRGCYYDGVTTEPACDLETWGQWQDGGRCRAFRPGFNLDADQATCELNGGDWVPDTSSNQLIICSPYAGITNDLDIINSTRNVNPTGTQGPDGADIRATAGESINVTMTNSYIPSVMGDADVLIVSTGEGTVNQTGLPVNPGDISLYDFVYRIDGVDFIGSNPGEIVWDGKDGDPGSPGTPPTPGTPEVPAQDVLRKRIQSIFFDNIYTPAVNTGVITIDDDWIDHAADSDSGVYLYSPYISRLKNRAVVIYGKSRYVDDVPEGRPNFEQKVYTSVYTVGTQTWFVPQETIKADRGINKEQMFLSEFVIAEGYPQDVGDARVEMIGAGLHISNLGANYVAFRTAGIFDGSYTIEDAKELVSFTTFIDDVNEQVLASSFDDQLSLHVVVDQEVDGINNTVYTKRIIEDLEG